ncbi:MAG: hypothetical protein ACXWV4_10295, partial [Flavitalea sp.]
MNPCTKFSYNLLLVCLMTIGLQAKAQVDTISVPMPVLGPNDTIPVPAMVVENEWIPGNNLQWHYVSKPYPKHLLKKKQAWTRLRNAVYVTYPYARKAGIIM